jgi:hypothetical protein
VLIEGKGHPGEDSSARHLGIYCRHRIVTLASYGLEASFISEHIGLPETAVVSVLKEEGPHIEQERLEREF